jgi:hypothetical protein
VQSKVVDALCKVWLVGHHLRNLGRRPVGGSSCQLPPGQDLAEVRMGVEGSKVSRCGFSGFGTYGLQRAPCPACHATPRLSIPPPGQPPRQRHVSYDTQMPGRTARGHGIPTRPMQCVEDTIVYGRPYRPGTIKAQGCSIAPVCYNQGMSVAAGPCIHTYICMPGK